MCSVCYGTAAKSARISARSASGNEGAAAIRSVRSTFISTVPYEIFSIFGATVFQILGARAWARIESPPRIWIGSLDAGRRQRCDNRLIFEFCLSHSLKSQSIWPRLRCPHGLFLSSTLFLLSFFQAWLCRKKTLSVMVYWTQHKDDDSASEGGAPLLSLCFCNCAHLQSCMHRNSAVTTTPDSHSMIDQALRSEECNQMMGDCPTSESHLVFAGTALQQEQEAVKLMLERE